MAGTPAEITHHGLDMLLGRDVATPLNRATAALLTLAFEIRKADYRSRGETFNEDDLKEEIKKVFFDLQGVTDPNVALSQARQRSPQKP